MVTAMGTAMATDNRRRRTLPERAAVLSSAGYGRGVGVLLALLLAGLAILDARTAARGDGLRLNDLNLASLTQTPGGRERLERDARDRLMAEPLSARALRQLGTARALAGDDAAAERLHGLAERLSRRDLGTQLWMIERSAAAGDVARTLRHYDLALTSEPASGDLLYPVLARAIADPAVSRSLTHYVRRDRPWVPPFLASGLNDAPSTALAALVAAAPPDTVKGIMGPLLTRLARERDFATARTLLRATTIGRAALNEMTVSERTTAPQLGPFGWQLIRSDAVDASLEGEGFVARIGFGASGLAAQRIFILPPGRYRFRYALTSQGMAGDASLSVDAECLGAPDIVRPLPAAVTEARDAISIASHDLVVAAGCGGLAIAFRVIGGDARQDETLRVDRIMLTQVPPGDGN